MKSPTKNIQPSMSRPNGVAKYTIRKIGPTRPPHSSTINWDFRYRANIGHAPRLAGPPSRVRVAPRNTVCCDCVSVSSARDVAANVRALTLDISRGVYGAVLCSNRLLRDEPGVAAYGPRFGQQRNGPAGGHQHLHAL